MNQKTFSYYVISESHEPFVMVSYLYIANEREGAAVSTHRNGGLHHLQEVIKGGFGGVPDKGIIG